MDNKITGKVCALCKHWKSFDDYTVKRKSPDGYNNYCKSCNCAKVNWVNTTPEGTKWRLYRYVIFMNKYVKTHRLVEQTFYKWLDDNGFKKLFDERSTKTGRDRLSHKLIIIRHNESKPFTYDNMILTSPNKKDAVMVANQDTMQVACIKCNIVRPLSEFSRTNKRNLSFSPVCKHCNKNTRIGYVEKLHNIYSLMKHRNKLDERKEFVGAGELQFTMDEFIEWAEANGYPKLYREWREKHFRKRYAPSPDRIDNTVGYTLDNIKMTTWHENHSNGRHFVMEGGHRNYKIERCDLEGKRIDIWDTAAALGREIGVSSTAIGYALKSKSGRTGDYIVRRVYD